MKFLRFLAAALLLMPPVLFAQDLARADAWLEKRFKQLDTNGDGKLSPEEVKPVAEWLKGADADGDGFLTLDEVRNHLRNKIATFIETRRGVTTSSQPVDEKAPPPFEPKDSPREEAVQLKPGACSIGSLIPDAPLIDLSGAKHSLRELTGNHPAVVALVSTSCPVSKRYLPTLAQLEGDYRTKGIAFVLVAQNPTDSADDLRAALKTAGLAAPCVRDPQNVLLKTLGATSSADVFLLDAAHTLVYRGAIDDQYGLGYSLEAPRHRYLGKALQSVIAGQPPEIAATQAPGCALDLAEAKAPTAGAITYHNRISRLVQANCLECHHAGGIAPFALETYDQVSAKSGMIRKMVSRGLMPPWFAAPVAGSKEGAHSPWSNDRSLAERDRTDLLAWLDAGKPLGDAKEAPLPHPYASQWAIGTPDAVLQIPRPIQVNATGIMPYQLATIETTFGEDKWVRGFEIQPTAREVVHHVIVMAQAPGEPLNRLHNEGGDGSGFFAAYVPGNNHVVYPDGFARLLPAGTKLIFQIHYTPNGTAMPEQMKIGLLFASETPQHIVHVAAISNHQISIPPGADHHAETATIPIPKDVKLLAFMPHMHVRGAAFRYEAILPDGSTHTLLDVPRYDFNWQLAYRYAEPPTLPMGSKIRTIAWYDNSTGNPANPDPTKTVHWGQQTYDEMMIGYVEYYLPDETPASKTAAR